MNEPAHPTHVRHPVDARGTAAGFGAYVTWGLFPLFFTLVERSGALEVLAYRVIWMLVVMIVVLAALGELGTLRSISARSWGIVTAASTLICVNWGVYIYAVTSGNVVEAALGYYINPLVSVLLGVLVFGERLSRPTIAALALATAAVVVITIDYGRPPVIALLLAFTFGTYGLCKKVIDLRPRTSLTAEGIVAAPVAIIYVIVLAAVSTTTFTTSGIGYTLLLMAAGPLTAIPLLLFGVAAQRIPLSMLGLLQYVTPTLQMLLGVLVLGETVSAARWIGFALIWTALVIFTVDLQRRPARP
ncbi:EamA family transporter RarD [Gordonia sp. ABSL1-1]|uniref:EamA family transporter RarD n=1 Tax=Gordonia sp. ABSL1-1 TaxID=3053923 RepID=UPI0025736CF2|nr:EamA family transporter RarD [Gordonia sp. ABSL1-1]MDL9936334.1 EamA family transporter RarD [Gordonia sp. ABSL1-1]